MSLRNMLVALIVVATAAFVVATSIERSSGESGHREATATIKPAAGQQAAPGAVHTQAAAESAATQAKEGAVKPAAAEKAVPSAVHARAGGESAAVHAKEGAPTPGAATTERPHAELRPLGINVESWPFATLAALGSLALALGAWLRPSLVPALGLVMVAMLAFAALDVGEVVHQSDVDKTGLAVVAGVIAAMHVAAAVVAAAMATRGSRPGAGRPLTWLSQRRSLELR